MMLTNQERDHIEEMAEAAKHGAFKDVRLLNRMLHEHTTTLLAEIDRLTAAPVEPERELVAAGGGRGRGEHDALRGAGLEQG